MKYKRCPDSKTCFGYKDDNCDDCDFAKKIIKLYKRIDRLKKQNETLAIQKESWKSMAEAFKTTWISGEDRLPERNGRYLTHCDIECQSLVCILHYCKVGGFNEGTVTHWMPLPEAPKMKGGE